jgi:hypothetical protein
MCRSRTGSRRSSSTSRNAGKAHVLGAAKALAIPLTTACRRRRGHDERSTGRRQVTLSLPILRKGQHSGEPPVERLQFMLNFVKGVDDLDVGGIFGPNTDAAVRGFQQTRTSRSMGSWAGRPGRHCCGAGCCSPSLASLLARSGSQPLRPGVERGASTPPPKADETPPDSAGNAHAKRAVSPPRLALCSGCSQIRCGRPATDGGPRRQPDQRRPPCRSGPASPGSASHPTPSGHPGCHRPPGTHAPRCAGTHADAGF